MRDGNQWDPPGTKPQDSPAPSVAVKGVLRVQGVARDVVTGSGTGEPPVQVLTFRVERDERQGGRPEPISVEMRGPRIRGAVTEGERVDVLGTWRDGMLLADEIDTSTGSTVRVPRANKAVKAILAAVTVLVVAGLVAVVVLVSAGGGVSLHSLGQSLVEISHEIRQGIGRPGRTVPDVVGLERPEAIDELRRAGFTQFELDLRGNPSCRVVRTDPAAGQTLAPDQKVVVASQPSGNDTPGCQ